MPVGQLVMIHAAIDRRHYDRARAGRPLDEAFPLEGNGMAEELFNPDRELILAAAAYSAWFYQDERTHRFDQASERGGRVIALRTVAQVRPLGERGLGAPRSIAALKARTLYLVLVRPGPGPVARATLALDLGPPWPVGRH
jgi:hypothetical protein